jgi:hypothetical protein
MTIKECREKYTSLLNAYENADITIEEYENNLEVAVHDLASVINKFSNPKKATWTRITKDLTEQERVIELIEGYGKEFVNPEWFKVLEIEVPRENSNFYGERERGQQMKPKDYGLKVELPKYSGEPGKYAKFTNQFEALLKMSKVETADWVMYLGQCMRGRASDMFWKHVRMNENPDYETLKRTWSLCLTKCPSLAL